MRSLSCSPVTCVSHSVNLVTLPTGGGSLTTNWLRLCGTSESNGHRIGGPLDTEWGSLTGREDDFGARLRQRARRGQTR